ncbi:MAG: hypothetical protein RL748_4523 [Pseudomonadota bacterium]
MPPSIFDQLLTSQAQRLPSLSQVRDQFGKTLAAKVGGQYAQPLARAFRGDVAGALQGVVGDFLGKQVSHALGRNPLLGGISMRELESLAQEALQVNYAKKNLFFISIEDDNPPNQGGDISHAFNLFCTDVAFGPSTITSETKNIGMAVMDVPTGSERTSFRITTYDDANGTIKRWFTAKCEQVAHTDGTIGLPNEYVFTLSITQAASDAISSALFGGLTSSFRVRAATMEIDQSRSEDAPEQVQMTFEQFDTFM